MQTENKNQPFVEIIREWNPADYKIRYALFDFDGTVSLIREGWQGIMIPYFTQVLEEVAQEETHEELEDLVRLFVTDLTGKQTIFQCIRLAEEVRKRGGTPLEPIEYKTEYLRRLGIRIRDRKEGLAAGTIDPDDWIVPGSRQFITMLREKGIHCLVASGTDDADVQREAQLLKIDELFDGGVFGARDDLSVNRKESEIREIKAMVIEDLLEKEGIDPSELISFGDGYVEVQLVAERGGLAIGVATNEDTRTGINEWKRGRLIVAGARAIAPDFSQPEELMRLLDDK
ncbi:MAG: HAD family hydrolase [Lachnospiraceae bacterium]|nr:HAD family hydrolase [Lachnospiraceae bacterium]